MRKYLDIIYYNRKEIFLVVIMFIGFILFNLYNNTSNQIEVVEEIKEEKATNKTIVIDIKGEVNRPGSYEIEEGKRVKDAIDLAEGLKEEASLDNINLSAKLTDEMLIYIPRKEEEKKEMIELSKDTKISINIATLTELMNISGIGKTKAQNIIDYRNKHGRFNSINDIMNVSGIGKSTFDKIKDFIKV